MRVHLGRFRRSWCPRTRDALRPIMIDKRAREVVVSIEARHDRLGRVVGPLDERVPRDVVDADLREVPVDVVRPAARVWTRRPLSRERISSSGISRFRTTSTVKTLGSRAWPIVRGSRRGASPRRLLRQRPEHQARTTSSGTRKPSLMKPAALPSFVSAAISRSRSPRRSGRSKSRTRRFDRVPAAAGRAEAGPARSMETCLVETCLGRRTGRTSASQTAVQGRK